MVANRRINMLFSGYLKTFFLDNTGVWGEKKRAENGYMYIYIWVL